MPFFVLQNAAHRVEEDPTSMAPGSRTEYPEEQQAEYNRR
jgi:hypothetical protein